MSAAAAAFPAGAWVDQITSDQTRIIVIAISSIIVIARPDETSIIAIARTWILLTREETQSFGVAKASRCAIDTIWVFV